MKNSKILTLIPIFLAFFVMGFVDMVGAVTHFVKGDFDLSDTVAGLLPMMVFLWFLVFSVPTGMLMNRIGRRKTVLLSIAITVVALLVPYLGYNFGIMLVAFSLLGIGNTLMQVSLNPLISNIVSSDRMASTLTFGQFVKAIASFLAPILAGWALVKFGDWKLLFPMFAVVGVIAFVYLAMTPIKEQPVEGKPSTFGESFGLLRDPMILMLFLGILVHVGLDVGINTTGPKLLGERLGYATEDAAFASSFYFVFRLAGCLAGAFILAHFSSRKFFIISIVLLAIAVAGLFVSFSLTTIYICLAIFGIGNANIFSIMFSQALAHRPDKGNEVSALMIMGVAGGAVFPPLMGVGSDFVGSQQGAIAVLAFCVLYLVFLISKIK